MNKPVANIWFKGRYVDAILSGKKTTTVRAKKPKYDAGDVVCFSVGSKSPFAFARIVAIEPVKFETLPPERQDNLRSLYPEQLSLFACLSGDPFWLIHFQLI